MSYIPSDFDNLRYGFNLLDVREQSTDLTSTEGGYTDKGYGYKQQYSLYGSLNSLLDPISPSPSSLLVDFCIIFKGNFTTSSVCNLTTYTGTGTFMNIDPQYISQEIDLLSISHTVTQDSDGNEVWLYEDFDFGALDEIRGLTASSYFCMYVKESGGLGYFYEDITSFGRDGITPGVDPTPANKQKIVIKWIQESTINFSIARKNNISDLMTTTFSGTFDNSYIGTGNNSIGQISINYVNPITYESEQVVLTEGVDYTVSGNTFYSGTESSASSIDIDLGEMFPQGIYFDLFIATDCNYKSKRDETFENLPLFNWGKDGNTNFFNVNGEYRINNQPITPYLPHILYESSEGSASTITLNDSVANYSYIEIYYRTNDGWGFKGSQKINAGFNGAVTSLRYEHIFSGTYYVKFAEISFNNKQIVFYDNRQYYYSNGSTITDNGSGNYIYILKVVGYK